jgi:pimeloyl-ACP methyl ester carboxylesterase
MVRPTWPVETVSLPRGTVVVRVNQNSSSMAEPALMLHGLGSSGRAWAGLKAELNDELDVVAPDLVGFGQSSPPPDGDYTPAAHARAMIEVAEARFGSRPFHLFGNSMGGHIAMRMAAMRPDLINSLTLIAPALPDPVPAKGAWLLPLMASPRVGEQIFSAYVDLPTEQRVRQTIAQNFARPEELDEAWVQELAIEVDERRNHPHEADAYVKSLRELLLTYIDRSSTRPWALVKRVQTPTLVIYGKHDRLVNARAAARVTREFPRAKVVVLPDAAHVPHMQTPDVIADLWRSFRSTQTTLTTARADA